MSEIFASGMLAPWPWLALLELPMTIGRADYILHSPGREHAFNCLLIKPPTSTVSPLLATLTRNIGVELWFTSVPLGN
jgi:hypothetical protein